MAEYKDREHYIPLRRRDLIELLCRDRDMTPALGEQFRRLAELLSATFHFEYHRVLEELKDEYAPFDPDACTKAITTLSPEQRAAKVDRLFARFAQLMERANFKRLDRQVILDAMREVSDWGLNMEVDFNVMERFDLYVRGDTKGTRYRRRLSKFWRLEAVQLPVYERLVLIVKLRPSKRLPGGIDTDDVFLKIFKDIPKMDLEMLLPGARMQMPGVARLKLGGSIVSGLGLITYNILKQALTAAALGWQFFWGPLVAVFGYGYRQYYGYQSAKTTHTLRLTQSLYYQNLGNNLGVLFHLIDEAEEQETREALLAYFHLWRHAGERGWTATDLDNYVEMDLERIADIKVDFEIDDALAKLERLQLVAKNGDRYVAVPIEQALERLDYAWDNYFKYNTQATAGPP
ncbi:MAG: TMEM143 family protein, partial [Gemmataceae bacterium]|nr:TMEM143 family protein [Gemmataceae bacterium]